jgi:hypothetical protein
VRNHKTNPNVVYNCLGLHAETGVMAFNISASSVEHSFLMPDDGPPVRVEQVDLPPEKWTRGYAASASACCGVM